MKRKSVALALMPACFVLSNLCASAHAHENSASAPELAAEANKPIAIERSIKIPGLAVAKEALPDMSESSAVRMACGGSPITVYTKYNPSLKYSPSPKAIPNATPNPRPVPVPHPVASRVNKAATTTVQPAVVKPSLPLVKPATPVFAPLGWFFHQ